MSKTKITLYVVALLILSIIGWRSLFVTRPGNVHRVLVTHQGDKYELHFRGYRRYMAHDLLAAIYGKTYIEKATIRFPRITGVVPADSLSKQTKGVNMLGSVSFDGYNMHVEIFYVFPPDTQKVPFTWNGDYQLVFEQDTT